MLRERFRNSLQFRMLAGLLVILLGTISLATAVIVYRDREFMRSSLVGKSLALGQYAADLSQEPLLLKDSLALDAIAQQMNLNDELAYSYIQDSGGVIQTGWFSSFNYSHFPDLRELLPQSTDVAQGVAALKSRTPIVEVTAPITIRGKALGQVVLGVSDYKIRRQINRMVLWLLGINACTILAAFLLLSTWLKTLTVPILELAGLMTRVSEDKDYGARAAATRKDEVGVLAQGFNGMLEQIQRRDAELDQHRRHLEEKVLERTAELSEANYILRREIEERESLEAALQDRERFLTSIFTSIQDGISVLDNDLRIIRVNAAMERWHAPAMPLVGKKCHQAYFGAREQCADCPSSRTLQTGQAASGIVERRRPDGAVTGWMEVFSYPLVDLTTGQTKGVIEYMRDVTDRKQAEDALAEETERLAVTLRSIGDGVITTDIEGNVVLLNKTAEKLTGWSQVDAVGKPLPDVFRIVDEKTREPLTNPALLAIRSNGLISLPHNTVLIGKDQAEHVVSDSCVPIMDRNSRVIGVVLVFRDVTQARWMEEELRKSQKLESIGVLAGGIAHDFNNILAAVTLNISMVKTFADLPEKAAQRLEGVEKALGRATDLTRQLLTFSKGGAPIKVTASIAELIRESATFALHGSDARCVFKIADDLLLADVDKGQISQAINNLIINAKEAMPQGGTITITGENEIVGPGDPRPLRPGAYIKVAVADTGTGIDKEQISRIFDPYFTTKKTGSGLGLAIVFSIVKRHNSHIEVQSKLGLGTTFQIYLPASVQAVPAAPEIARPTVRGKGRILIMDDETMIAEALSEALRDLGYDVQLSLDGVGAISAYRQALQDGKPFDVVIMDLTIPGGMGGKEAIGKLLALDPQAKAVVSSGYSTDAVMANYKAHGFSGVIVKPYNIGALSDLLHTLTQSQAS